MEALQPAQLSLQADGTPYSEAYGDVYHSAHGGPEQARHVFLGGNDLPGRWQRQARFVILETGFGLGLNFLTTWAAWAADPERCDRLHFISVEKHPFEAADLARAQTAWPLFAPLAAELQARWPLLLPGTHRLEFAGGRVVLTLIFGDATRELREIEAEVDAFYLDGFSPARNPELWTPELARSLTRLAGPGATLATWSVAGHVRQALDAAGFDLEKRPGFAGKRQMLTGRNRSRRPRRHSPPQDRRALVIGAGLAGSLVAERLAARDWQVTVLDRHAEPAQGASGNLAGALRPLPSVDDNVLARLTRAGFLSTLRRLHALGGTVCWSPCGVLHLARDAEQAATQRRALEALAPPADYLQFLDADTASQRLGAQTAHGGWWFPGGGWVQPPSLCRAALAAWPERIVFHGNANVSTLCRMSGEWQALDAEGRMLAAAPHLVIASGYEAARLLPALDGLIVATRGQVTHVPVGTLATSDCVVCGDGYVAPAVDGWHALGATSTTHDPEPGLRESDHRANLAKLARLLPGALSPQDVSSLGGRVGFRPATPDRLPIVGLYPDQPDLSVALGYGARGLVWCALMAETLVAALEGEPAPISRALLRAIWPRRFRMTPSPIEPAIPERD